MSKKKNKQKSNDYTIFCVTPSNKPVKADDSAFISLRWLEGGEMIENELTCEDRGGYDPASGQNPGRGSSPCQLNKYLPEEYMDYRQDDRDKRAVYGIQTNEASIKSVLQERDIDELIIIATSRFCGKSSLYTPDDAARGMSELKLDPEQISRCTEWNGSTLDYLLSELFYYSRSKTTASKELRKVFIYPIADSPDEDSMIDCSFQIVSHILSATTNHPGKIQLYIDSNGGKRELIVLQIGMLRALSVYNIKPEKILYSDYTATNKSDQNWGDSPVLIKSSQYNIFNLVSGLDEFIEYGRVNQLQNYFSNFDISNQQNPISRVLDAVGNMCNSFTTCFAESMVNSVQEAADEINKFNNTVNTSPATASQLEKDIVKQISEDLGSDLLSNAASTDSAILPLITWCYRKNFYQQAITLYVEKMPAWYVSRNLLNNNIQGRDLRDPEQFYEILYEDYSLSEYQRRLRRIIDQYEQDSAVDWNLFINRLNSFNAGTFGLPAGWNQFVISNINTTLAQQSNTVSPNQTNRIDSSILKEIRSNAPVPPQLSGSFKNSIDIILAASLINPNAQADLINNLTVLMGQNLHLNRQLFNNEISLIRRKYNAAGYRAFNTHYNRNTECGAFPGRDGLSPTIMEFMNSYLKKYYELSDPSWQQYSTQNNHTNIKQKLTYIKKMKALQHLDPNSITGIINTANGTHDFEKICQYYLAFKILRNNSNHANGTEGLIGATVCRWLSNRGILTLAPGRNINNNQISFDYDVTDKLLKDAINYNRSLRST